MERFVENLVMYQKNIKGEGDYNEKCLFKSAGCMGTIYKL